MMVKGHRWIPSMAEKRGSILISLIITMVILSVLGAAMLSFFSTSTMSQLGGNSSMRAYYLAESGYRYVDSEYSNAGSESAKNAILESLHNKDYKLSGKDGKFHLDTYPYYYQTTADHPAGSTTLNTKVCGGFPPGLVFTSGYLKADSRVYNYTNAEQSGPNVTFTISGGTAEISNDTTVYSVSHSSSNRTVTNLSDNNYIDLETSTGSRNAFPLLNGTFKIDGSINPNRIWNYKKRDVNRLEGITPGDDPNGGFNLYIDTTYDIVLDKFVKLKSTGIVDSGSDLETKREITYHIPIFEESRGKVTYIETFEDGGLPGSFAGGAGEVGAHEVVDGALHVTTTSEGESSIDFNWRSTYINLEAVWQDAGNLLSYDLQTKIRTSDESYPDNKPPFFMAGISFRKVSAAAGTDLYGISYLRARQVRYKTSSSGEWSDYEARDNIPSGIKPDALFEGSLEYSNKFSGSWGDWTDWQFLYSKPAIVLWQRTSDGYKWLAYKTLTNDDFVVYELDSDHVKLRLKDWSNLQVRVIEAYPLDFSGGGPATFLYGDTITIMRGTTRIGTARVNGTPILTSDNWAANGAAGTLTLSDVQLEDGMSVQNNDDLQVNGVTRARASGTLGFKTNFIRAYYGDENEHTEEGLFNSDPQDNIRKSNPRISASGEMVNWPVDNVSEWAADNDYLTLVQWTGFNTGVPAEVSTVEPNAIIEDSTLQSPSSDPFDRPEIALHTFGDTSASIYFDDFAIQAENRTSPASLPVIQQ